MLSRIKKFGVWMIWGSPKPVHAAVVQPGNNHRTPQLTPVDAAGSTDVIIGAQDSQGDAPVLGEGTTLDDLPPIDPSIDQPVIDPDTGSNPDPLSKLLTDLQDRSHHMHAELKFWEEEKIRILGNDYRVTKPAVEAETRQHETARDKIKKFFERIVSYLRFGEQQIEHLINDASPHINELKLHLVERRNKLIGLEKLPDRSIDDIRLVQSEIFDTGIEMWSELWKLNNDIIGEVDYCLKCEKGTERVAVNILHMAGSLLLIFIEEAVNMDLRAVLDQLAPACDMDLEGIYRNVLEVDIQPVIIDEAKAETSDEAELRRALILLSQPVLAKNPLAPTLFKQPAPGQDGVPVLAPAEQKQDDTSTPGLSAVK